VISLEARIAFLRRIHLFHDLGEEDLAAVAEQLQEQNHGRGDGIFGEGDEADRWYIIQRGAVRLSRVESEDPPESINLVDGDYFGEGEALSGSDRRQDAKATEDTLLLCLPADDLTDLLKQMPALKKALDVAIASRRLAQRAHFDWLGPAEVVYFMARKHEVLLAQALSLPILALAVPLFLMAQFFLTRAFLPIFAAGVSSLLIVVWIVWNVIDWGNDFYIVTNQRVIWLEKVVGIYDSRQEAPLSTILSVGVETDISGRMLDYGDLVVRTFVGKIVFSHVSHPSEAARLVEEHWSRSKRSASRQEKEAMRNVLRRKMGLPVQVDMQAVPQPEHVVTPSFYRRSMLKVIGSNWFKLRVEDGGNITYRKHWFVLIKQVTQPTVAGLLVVAGVVARLLTLANTPGVRLIDTSKTPPVDTLMLVFPVLLLPIAAWWIYQYVDWRNDIYMVTSDQILDIDKKPFGSQTRRSAPLENILSTEAERIGVAGYLLNFGTVYITVGGANLDFEDVMDPTGVQADVDRRREARVAMKKEMEAASERERMSDWLIAYHENEDELRQSRPPDEPEAKSR
jgi:CRP-like cAMP-binding protein